MLNGRRFREAAITGPGGRSSVVGPHCVEDVAKLNVSRGLTCKSTFPAVFFRAKGGMKAGRSRLEPRSVCHAALESDGQNAAVRRGRYHRNALYVTLGWVQP